MVAKSASFERATGRVGLDEEPQQHFGAAKTLERNTSAVVRGEREIRRWLSDFDHSIGPVVVAIVIFVPITALSGIGEAITN